MISKKGYLQFSFAWLFAIIVGAFILFLAIFAATKIINTENTQSNTEISKEIGVLLNPLETSFQEAQVVPLSLKSETRIYTGCSDDGNFGKQSIRVSQKTFNKWSEPSVDVSFSNKYIFSEYPAEGKKFYLFSKPFEFPFKVADVVYLIPAGKNYCFSGLNDQRKIKEELENLNQPNILVENCTATSVKVCFKSSTNCDINVNYNSKYVDKKGQKVWFETDALMYAAIFSDKNNYECQVKRLMKKTNHLSDLYLDKSNFISTRVNCGNNMDDDLTVLSIATKSLESSSGLSSINNLVEEVKQKNEDRGECKLW